MKKSDNSFETKTKKVANHLIANKSITSWDAINKFKATRLSAIIFNLKKRGFIIETKMEQNGNSHFGRYHFKGMKKK
ncbi:MAG: hypothetical protein IPJ01_10810 [Micavibrio sp.]|nr:hypothetical protein [Micavibrio sp.]